MRRRLVSMIPNSAVDGCVLFGMPEAWRIGRRFRPYITFVRIVQGISFLGQSAEPE